MGIILFFVIQVVKYCLHIFKYSLALLGNNKWLAIIESSLYTALDILVLKNLGNVSIELALTSSLFANGLATYLNMYVTEHFVREKMFEYEIVVDNEKDADIFEDILVNSNWKYLRQWGFYKDNKYFVFKVRAYNKQGSRIIKAIINDFRDTVNKKIRYTIIATNTVKEDNFHGQE